MPFARKSGGVNITPTTVKRRSGAAWVDVQTVRRRSGGSWVTVSPITAISASPNPSNVTVPRVGSAQPSSLTVSGTINLTVTGGIGTITYSTTLVSGTAMSVAGGNTASPSISATCTRNATVSAVYRFEASDGSSSKSVDVSVSRTYSWSGS